MEMQHASDQTAFVGHTTQASAVNNGEGSEREGQALWEERERRRVQFRSSLIHARSYLSRAATALSMCVPSQPQ